MTIAKRGQGSKETLSEAPQTALKVPRDLLIVGGLVAASVASFGLGSAFSHPNLPAAATHSSAAAVVSADAVQSSATTGSSVAHSSSTKATKKVVGHASGTYVASKNGTKYYLPTCASANRIKDENKIWFVSKEEAAAAGYGPSSTCKGL